MRNPKLKHIPLCINQGIYRFTEIRYNVLNGLQFLCVAFWHKFKSYVKIITLYVDTIHLAEVCHHKRHIFFIFVKYYFKCKRYESATEWIKPKRWLYLNSVDVELTHLQIFSYVNSMCVLVLKMLGSGYILL